MTDEPVSNEDLAKLAVGVSLLFCLVTKPLLCVVRSLERKQLTR